MTIKNFNDFINEANTYADLAPSLESAFKKTGIQDSCYDNKIKVNGSMWNIGHPNGSIGVTFWLMEPVPTIVYKDALKTAKSWAKQNNLIAATFYPDGVALNDKGKQDWGNKSAMNAKYVWGFTFYTKEYQIKIYTEL